MLKRFFVGCMAMALFIMINILGIVLLPINTLILLIVAVCRKIKHGESILKSMLNLMAEDIECKLIGWSLMKRIIGNYIRGES